MPVEMNMEELLNQYKNMNSRFEVKNELSDSSGPAEIYIYGTISAGWFSDISSREIKRKLEGITKDEIHVHINSPGGDVFESVAIHNLLKNHKAKISIYIDGIAASGASVIAMAGDQVIMPSNTMMMIHNAWTYASGNADQLRKAADDIERINQSMIQFYLDRAGDKLDADTLKRLLDAETWLNAEDAMSYGLCDEIIETNNAAACIDEKWLKQYKNVPKKLVSNQNIAISAEEMAQRQLIADEAKANSDYINTILGGL